MRFTSLPIGVVLFLLAQNSAFGNENVKTFASQHCRYTLPSNKWNWTDHSDEPDAVCAAKHDDGRVMFLYLTVIPKNVVITEASVKVFDRGAVDLAKMKKRGGRITAFKNLPCYECELLADGAMVAQRLILANGFGYQIYIRDGLREVEKLPDYEAIMDGFEFTSPPVPHSAGPVDPVQNRKGLSSGMFSVGFYILIPLGFIWIFRNKGKKKA